MSYKGGRVGDDLGGPTRTGWYCKATNCPNAGCIDGLPGVDNSGMCYWHWAESDPRKWDAITANIRANFARMANYPEPHKPPQPVPRQQAVEAMRSLRLEPKGTQWAEALRDRELSGQYLTAFQRQSWREVCPNDAA